MNRSTYKAGRRMIFATKVAEFFEALYGLRAVANAEADFDDMLLDDDNLIDYTPEGDEDED